MIIVHENKGSESKNALAALSCGDGGVRSELCSRAAKQTTRG